MSTLVEQNVEQFQSNESTEEKCNDYILDPEIKSLDFKKIIQIYKKCRVNDEDILLKEFMVGLEEIKKFFSILGKIFSFGLVLIDQQINAVLKHLNGSEAQNYISLKSSIEHEKSKNIHMGSKDSATTNVYRITFFLDYATGLLEAVDAVEENDALGNHTGKVYDKTLGQVQGWILSKTTRAGMSLLPTKKNYILLVETENKKFREQLKLYLPELVALLRTVLEDCEKIFDGIKTKKMY